MMLKSSMHSVLSATWNRKYGMHYYMNVSIDPLHSSSPWLVGVKSFTFECTSELLCIPSGIDEKPFRRYLHEATHSFPISIATYPNSLIGKTLQRVVAGLAFLQVAVPVKIPVAIQQQHIYVGHAMTVLSSLASIDVDAMLEAQLKDTRIRLSSRRKDTREQSTSEYLHLDASITALGHDVPRSKLQWESLSQQILANLKEILEVRMFCFHLQFPAHHSVV